MVRSFGDDPQDTSGVRDAPRDLPLSDTERSEQEQQQRFEEMERELIVLTQELFRQCFRNVSYDA